jgi:hypothetical protein
MIRTSGGISSGTEDSIAGLRSVAITGVAKVHNDKAITIT